MTYNKSEKKKKKDKYDTRNVILKNPVKSLNKLISNLINFFKD